MNDTALESPVVLVVDDDPDVRDLIEDYLSGQGYRVLCAADAGTARGLLKTHAPEVALLDVGLPGEDGLTLARFIRERLDIGIIMVSGAGETLDRIVGLEVGADSDRGQPMPNLEYGLAGTPCQLVLDEGFQLIGADLSRRNQDSSLHWDEVTLKRATLGGIDRLVAITREITERKRTAASCPSSLPSTGRKDRKATSTSAICATLPSASSPRRSTPDSRHSCTRRRRWRRSAIWPGASPTTSTTS